MIIETVNTTAVIDIKCKVDLDNLPFKNAKRGNSRFKVLLVKRRSCRALIYESGKIILTGNKNIVAARRAARTLVKTLVAFGLPATMGSFYIANLVGKVQFPAAINIIKFATECKASYEVELFPAAIYNLGGRISATIFPNGKFFITGCKTLAQFTQSALELTLIVGIYQKSPDTLQ